MLDEYLDKYREVFKEGFPMYQCGRGRSDAEIVEIIKQCIDTGNDVYELGYAVDDDEGDY